MSEGVVLAEGVVAVGGGGGGSGTVTSFAFTNANGFTGVVTNPTTTPTLEISGPSAGMAYGIKTANYSPAAGEYVYCDTTGGAFTITLPVAPSAGDAITIKSGPAAVTNALTIARNGKTIMSLAENMTVSSNNIEFTLVYDGATWGL